MKKRNSLFLLTLSFCLLISPIFAFADETKPINEWFKRPSIAQFVADKLSLTTSDLVSQSQLDEIKTFNPAVGELVDMESFLEIASLRKLENIYLRKQSLKNFEGVENFKELDSLMVVESPIESISGIEQLPVLTLLSIGYNYSPVFIENPSALAPIDGVPSLVNIDLRMLDLTNDHLSKLKNNNQNLRNINLHGNNLTSFEGLDVFPNLKNLRASQNNLTKMDGIESLKQLEMLDINNENFDKSYGNGIVDSSLFTMCDESCLYYDMDRHKVILDMEKGIDDKYYIDLNQFIVPSVSNNAVKKFHFKLTNIAAGKYDEGKNIVEFTTEEIENINFSEDFLEVTLKDQNNQSYGRIFIYSDKPNVKRDVFKVVYRDGIQDEHSFKDQVYEGIEEGSLTPKYVGTPQREGYRFRGWSPEVSETVTENTVYVAQWEKNIEVKKTYEVVYRDGIQDEDSFKDQVYGGIEEGSLTPEYVGTPQRKGYRFKGWSPEVSETVTENTVYVAQWEKNIEVKKTYEVVYRDGIQDEHSFKDQVYEGIEEGSLTPKYVGTPQREGYRFRGWSPEVSETVTENTVYVAQWEKNIEVKKTYEVVYRDGIQDEDSFKDQVYGGIEEGSLTPEYVGTPQRKGYRFKGWSPKVSETVTENTVYVAQWELSVSIANPTALPPTGLSNNNLFLIGIGLVLTSLAPLSIRKNRN